MYFHESVCILLLSTHLLLFPKNIQWVLVRPTSFHNIPYFSIEKNFARKLTIALFSFLSLFLSPYNQSCYLLYIFQVNHIRKVHRIHVHGTDIPDTCESFEKLSTDYGIHSRIIQNIKAVGYVTPTPIQMQAIPVMLHVSIQGRNPIQLCIFGT